MKKLPTLTPGRMHFHDLKSTLRASDDNTNSTKSNIFCKLKCINIFRTKPALAVYIIIHPSAKIHTKIQKVIAHV